MTRRKFLGLTFLTSVIIFTGGFQFLNSKKIFHNYLKKLLPWLNISSVAFDKFIDDYYKYKIVNLKSRIKLFILLTIESFTIFHFIARNKRKSFQNNITTRLLLSTDFFQENADEERIIKYSLYYDPYINPCYNPRP